MQVRVYRTAPYAQFVNRYTVRIFGQHFPVLARPPQRSIIQRDTPRPFTCLDGKVAGSTIHLVGGGVKADAIELLAFQERLAYAIWAHCDRFHHPHAVY